MLVTLGLKGLNCQVSLVGYDQPSAQRKLTVQVVVVKTARVT